VSGGSGPYESVSWTVNNSDPSEVIPLSKKLPAALEPRTTCTIRGVNIEILSALPG
jgi:hypothetical protein